MKFKEAEKRRLKKIAKFSSGKTLDIGFNEKPNIYLKNPDGYDIIFGKKPYNYNKIWKKFEEIHSNYYDTVIAGQVIEHIGNFSKFLNECNRILKKNGRFIISTENPLFIINLIGEFTLYKTNKYSRSEHIALYSMKRLIFNFNKHGFIFEFAKGCGFELPFIDYTLDYNNPLISKRVIYIAKKNENINNNT
jgi:SAM-dependent methyltransferase